MRPALPFGQRQHGFLPRLCPQHGGVRQRQANVVANHRVFGVVFEDVVRPVADETCLRRDIALRGGKRKAQQRDTDHSWTHFGTAWRSNTCVLLYATSPDPLMAIVRRLPSGDSFMVHVSITMPRVFPVRSMVLASIRLIDTVSRLLLPITGASVPSNFAV